MNTCHSSRKEDHFDQKYQSGVLGGKDVCISPQVGPVPELGREGKLTQGLTAPFSVASKAIDVLGCPKLGRWLQVISFSKHQW